MQPPRSTGAFIISPLEQGYGITVGNALRRVLLSSLPGAAVTSIRVSGVHHEFSAIPHVKEDMTQLILQVKQLRLKLYDAESARLRLEVHGEGTVTAADILCPAEVEIINPDLYLFTADSDDAQLEIEFTVQAGRGFSPAEERGRLPIGELPVDAIFSPIQRVNYDVERARVGQRTNYDKLILEIWTDGTIRPEEAMSQSAEILMKHLIIIAGCQRRIADAAGGRSRRSRIRTRCRRKSTRRPSKRWISACASSTRSSAPGSPTSAKCWKCWTAARMRCSPSATSAKNRWTNW